MDHGELEDMNFGRDSQGHRWSGWPGAYCWYCHIEDQDEIALADGAELPFPTKNPVCAAPADVKEKVDRQMNPEAFK